MDVIQESRQLLQIFNLESGSGVSKFLDRWNSPGRVYHDMSHISKMLDDINDMAGFLGLTETDRATLHLAAWYHDIIYVPGDYENEANSADLALEETGRMDIMNLVMVTKHHNDPRTFLEACLIDADLAGLGSKEYYTHAFGVKAEYPGITDEQWQTGRINFLRTFLERPVIYFTAWGAKHEELARYNLLRELEALRGDLDSQGVWY